MNSTGIRKDFKGHVQQAVDQDLAGIKSKNQRMKVGSKRRNVIKGNSKGKENKVLTRVKAPHGLHMGSALEPINSNQFVALQAGETSGCDPTSVICAESNKNSGPATCVDQEQTLTLALPKQVRRTVMPHGTEDDAVKNQDISLISHQPVDELMSDQDKEASISRANQLGFSHMELMDGEGYSGGIWCFWEPTISHVAVLERHHQYMHLQITRTIGLPWYLTIVYASPVNASRRTLWSNLSQLAQTIQGAWMIGGDLNGTILHCERRSSATFCTSYDRDLLRWVDLNDMQDLGFVGPEFTWKRGASEARLDRMLANEQWFNLFPNASVAHLPFFKSDHRPLLLRLDTTVGAPEPNRPFRFIAAWVLHEEFDEFVRKSWLQDTSWTQNISQFTHACSKWNKEVFKHTEGRKKLLLRRLDGISKAVARHGLLPRYEELQLSLWKELEDVLLQESLIWAKKLEQSG
ncbi:hypothetical protein K1719_016281 [Acacia pycnantha]|nr:hypothetical protein K1719_016281 [Acacia pycnantha]